MSINIDELARQAYAERQQAIADEVRAANEAKNRERQFKLDKLADAVKLELGDELVSALGIQFAWHDLDGEMPSALFTYAGKLWVLRATADYPRTNYDSAWRYQVAGYHGIPGVDVGWSRKDCLKSDLLISLGQFKVLSEAAAKKAAEDAERRRIADAERSAEEAARRQEEEAAQARIDELLDAARRDTLAALWKWPEGVSIEVYRVRWCNAAGVNEFGEASFHFDEEWSAHAEPDADGWWHFRVRRYTSEPETRVLRLTVEHHKVIPERFTLSSVEDAARLGLTESVTAVAWGVRHDASGFVEDPDSNHEFWIDAHIPLEWVRQLADKALPAVYLG